MSRTGLQKYVLRHRQAVEESAGGYLLFVQVAMANITAGQRWAHTEIANVNSTFVSLFIA